MKKQCKRGHILNKSTTYRYKYKSGTIIIQCRKCTSLNMKKWEEKNLDYHKIYQIEYNKTGKPMAYKKRWESNNPLKREAHVIVRKAIKEGKLKRNPCEVCGELKSDGHHPDYSKPLEVMWLCRQHHKEIHSKKIK